MDSQRDARASGLEACVLSQARSRPGRPGPYEAASRPTSYICRTYKRGTARSRGQGLCVEIEDSGEEASGEDEEEEANQQEQSVEQLLSGPKDSVMMFAGQPRLQFDLSAGSTFEDPLDLLLAHAVEREVGGNAGSSTDQFSQAIGWESLTALLSGPKDSVMMFGAKDSHCSQARFLLDMSGQEDPLDALVRNCTHAQAPTTPIHNERQAMHTMELARRCKNELSMLHKQQQEWDEASCRQALHRELDRELDIFLDDASRKSDVLDSATSFEVNELKEKLVFQDKKIESLTVQIDVVERAKQDALYARDESHADWEVAALELWDCRQQMEQLQDTVTAASGAEAASKAHLDEALELLANQSEKVAAQDRIIDKATSQIRQLQGERDALRPLSSAELSSLADTLMESLQRVQRAQKHRFEQRMDEQLCVVCLSERKTVVLQPCNHLTMCANCFDRCSSACPQCRSTVEGHLIIYM